MTTSSERSIATQLREPGEREASSSATRRSHKVEEIRLFIEDDQEIFREALRSAFPEEAGIRLVGVRGDDREESITEALSYSRPDVVIIGTKTVDQEVIDKLDLIRDTYSQIGIVLLCGNYGANGTRLLKEFLREHSRISKSGFAYLLKSSIDTAGQVIRVVHAVTEGRITLDPGMMQDFIADESESLALGELTAREMEILGLMAGGYKNSTIAEILFLEPKTVERHINSIYNKLSETLDDSYQARVNAILLYLKSTGQLITGSAHSENPRTRH
jgi:DNA-binding NarL/FixJ family response regulator